jgi:hypothetical protein
MCEADSLIRCSQGHRGEFKPAILMIPDAEIRVYDEEPRSSRAEQILLESLILAQDERWRRA